MFENLEVKDPREASKRFKEVLEKERIKHAEKLSKLEKEFARKQEEHEMAISRRDLRIDELKNKVEESQGSLQEGVSKAMYERERLAHKENVGKWEKVFKDNESRWKSEHAKLVSLICYLVVSGFSDILSSKKPSIKNSSIRMHVEILRRASARHRPTL